MWTELLHQVKLVLKSTSLRFCQPEVRISPSWASGGDLNRGFTLHFRQKIIDLIVPKVVHSRGPHSSGQFRTMRGFFHCLNLYSDNYATTWSLDTKLLDICGNFFIQQLICIPVCKQNTKVILNKVSWWSWVYATYIHHSPPCFLVCIKLLYAK